METRPIGENWARGLLHKSAVAGAIVGSRNPARVNGATGAGEFRLTDGEAREIEAN